MNREIKFRGKHYDNGVWIYGFLTHNKETGKSWIGSFAFGNYYFSEVDPKTVGQYTGRKDKNGKDIYEGDLLKVYKPNAYLNGDDYNEVRWVEKESAFGYFNLRCGFFAETKGNLINIGYNERGSWCEVIGNIYKNPNLLTNGK